MCLFRKKTPLVLCSMSQLHLMSCFIYFVYVYVIDYFFRFFVTSKIKVIEMLKNILLFLYFEICNLI